MCFAMAGVCFAIVGLVLGVAAIGLAPASAQVAQGQERGDWFVSVGGVIVAEPGSESAFPIVVGPTSALPVGAAVRVIGLSPYCELIGGTQLAQGAWSIPAEELGRLRIRVPQVDPVRMAVRFALVDSGGTVLAQAQSTFMIAKAAELAPADLTADGQLPAAPGAVDATQRIVRPPTFAPFPRAGGSKTGAIEPGAAAGGSGSAAVQPNAPASGPGSSSGSSAGLSGEALKAALAQMQRGNSFVSRGDYATARLFFRKAAELGHAPGATALAKTFDPVELRRLGVVGFTGNDAEANKWYERARELGAASR